MPILLAGTIEFVHIDQVSALFTFRLGQVFLYNENKVFISVYVYNYITFVIKFKNKPQCNRNVLHSLFNTELKVDHYV
jgi:hypothetical protein